MSLNVSASGELWRRTLSQIPSLFGRLVYLSSLRDPNTGEYQHFGFAQRFTDKEADRTLRRSHTETFSDWLCYSLEEQKTDLDLYLASLPQDSQTVIANWKLLPPFTNLVPVPTREAQRALFLADLRLVVELYPEP
jgi:hypothetical protein